MAQGFGTGLIHGSLASAAALLGLSLLAPLPDTPVAANDPAVADQPSGEGQVTAPSVPDVAEPQATEVPAILSETPEAVVSSVVSESGPLVVDSEQVAASTDPEAEPASDEPRSQVLDLPVGSEFGRSTDLAPPVPAFPDLPSASLTEAPAVVAPIAEPSPVASVDPMVVRTPSDQSAAAELRVPETEESSGVTALRPVAAPMPVQAPAGLNAGGAPDASPEGLTAVIKADPVPAADSDNGAEPNAEETTATEGEPEPVAETAATGDQDRPSETAQPEQTLPISVPPAIQAAPALDLSTPPDLTGLRALERN